MKRWIILLHRYLGLACALGVLILGLSGGLLVFKKELSTASGERPAAVSGPFAGYQALYQAATERHPGGSVNLRFGETLAEPVQARIRGAGEERLLWLDPVTAEVVSDRAPDEGLFNWLRELHEALLMDDAGETLVGVIGIGLLLMAISGLIYWWPKDWKRAWRVRTDKGMRILVSDLHRVAGAALSVVLLISALTGVLLVFSKPVNGWINALYGAKPDKGVKVVPGDTRLPLDLLVAKGDAALPGGRLVDIRVDAKADKPVLLRKRLPGEIQPNGRSMVEVDPYRGEVLKVRPVDKAEPGIRLTTWVYAFHIGSVGGLLHRVLMLVTGLVLAMLGVSGVYQWAAREWKQRRAAPRRLATRGA
ncbi:PepSY domain-containing protein [Pseudogulbenkiania sp. MAI-1]|uniref:PepSY-associated TM helix domain-containing protein n=1 Tax=Pseudogulbenkiania sp. MAI-1 TaxID=990370 RepID=UPI00045E6BFD|nr:PepSY-associated TM helix domain-containing protein [Pseudogulbenkiania sp. MAI-1]